MAEGTPSGLGGKGMAAADGAGGAAGDTGAPGSLGGGGAVAADWTAGLGGGTGDGDAVIGGLMTAGDRQRPGDSPGAGAAAGGAVLVAHGDHGNELGFGRFGRLGRRGGDGLEMILTAPASGLTRQTREHLVQIIFFPAARQPLLP